MTDTMRVETLITKKTKEAILQEAAATPLAVSAELRGNAEGEAEYGTELEWKHDSASVKISAAVRVRCGSDTQRTLAALDHCKSLVQATLAAEVASVNRLLTGMGGNDAGTSGH